MRILRNILVFVSIISLVEQTTAKNADLVALALYEGAESILLVWDAPENTLPVQTIIYRKADFQSPFQKLTELTEAVTRYCDHDLENGHRYFYMIELMDESGDKFVSEKEIPPFGRLLPQQDPIDEVKLLRTKTQTVTVEDVYHYILSSSIKSQFPSFDPKDTNELTHFIQGRMLYKHPWINLFIRNDFNRYTPFNQLQNHVSFLSELTQICKGVEPFVRNKVLLTPKEWEESLKQADIHVQNRLDELSNSFSDEVEFYQTLPPLWITQFISSEAKNRLQILVINPDTDGEDFVLSYGDEHITIPIDPVTKRGDSFYIQIPSEWKDVRLMSQGRVYQSVPITIDEGYTISLDGEFYTDLEESTVYEKHPVWINEWQVVPSENQWSVELVGEFNPETSYRVYLEDEVLWEINPTYIDETMFIDSTFSIDILEESSAWIHLKVESPDGERVIESKYLDKNTAVFQGRNPDGGKWYNDQPTTLGKSNLLTKNDAEAVFVPEIFALYQNYPNPFNRGTTIFFDMIEPAMVDLYITDATGRIIEIFLEDEMLSKGPYQYQWEAFQISSGVYFITLVAAVDDYPPVVFSRKMIYLK